MRRFFEQSRMSLLQVCIFANLWLQNSSLLQMASQAKITRATAVHWASFCREVEEDGLTTNNQKIGSVGKVVEIDESKLVARSITVVIGLKSSGFSGE